MLKFIAQVLPSRGFLKAALVGALAAGAYAHTASLVSLAAPDESRVASSCKRQWKKYDYNRFQEKTPQGNLGYTKYAQSFDRRSCLKDWTFLVYQSADNDLGPYALADLYEMEAGFGRDHFAGSTARTDLIVEHDGPGVEGVRRFHIFETPEVYDSKLDLEYFQKLNVNQIRSPIVELLDEESLGPEGERLKNFLAWGIENYPAKNYGVIIWGHGQGWTSIVPELPSQSEHLHWTLTPELNDNLSDQALEVGEARRFGGLAFDDESYLSIPELRNILSEVRQEWLGGRPFDLYISDACLMQQWEVAYELRNEARFIIGSPQSQNYLGLPYRRFFNRFNRGSFLQYKKKVYGREVASGDVDQALLTAYMLPELMRSSLSRGGRAWQMDREGSDYFSMSSINSHALKFRFQPLWENFAESLLAYLNESPNRVFELRFVFQEAISFGPGMKDLGSLLTLMGQWLSNESLIGGALSPKGKALEVSLNQLWAALRETVVHKTFGQDHFDLSTYPGFSGVGIWLPRSRNDFLARFPDFSKAESYGAEGEAGGLSAWPEVLELSFASP